jgi:hypothetical protein
MPKREVVFSGLFAFGAGVAVGANLPKASNIVGYILSKLGFELTDLAWWMWEPEEFADRSLEIAPVGRTKAKKKTSASRTQPGNLTKKENRAQAKKSKRSPRGRSGAGIICATRKKAVKAHEPWIRSSEMNDIGC